MWFKFASNCTILTIFFNKVDARRSLVQVKSISPIISHLNRFILSLQRVELVFISHDDDCDDVMISRTYGNVRSPRIESCFILSSVVLRLINAQATSGDRKAVYIAIVLKFYSFIP